MAGKLDAIAYLLTLLTIVNIGINQIICEQFAIASSKVLSILLNY
ncbi:hypothetical protein ACE1AT_24735 [Pelatocladus sp. BLCC-F211]